MGGLGGAHQLGQLVVGLEAPQQAAELVVVRVLRQALLRAHDVARARDERVQQLAALRVAHEQAAPHARQPHLRRVRPALPSAATFGAAMP